ncbi:Phosphoserine phosphatase RsbP [Caulifigura coniformis]|uniref:Phosphoserine phosphatase RsbP n=1 Tax=Caulifigura coniformis TaxID=2527983 RepID=A0A517SBV2_9PLAN|nr:PP2C family protein-serine/threonine phosphatase [Caulifigura coniformis]QDT53584.1 Phosphoserine phosphatase RsbP [Caulifigura coniformis]
MSSILSSRSAPKVRSWNPRLLNGTAMEIITSELPANRVCGDISDVFQAGEHSLLVAMGDASGHGVAAGMLIVDVRRLLSMMAGSGFDPGEMMSRVNRHVMQRFPTSRFVTLSLLMIDMATGALSFASAGQPFYRLDAEGRTTICDSDSAPIGILDDEVFPTTPLDPLKAGESLILISDGFREALNNDGQMYGEPRMFAQFAAGREESARPFIDRLYSDVDLYKAGNTDHDDMTVVLVRTSN